MTQLNEKTSIPLKIVVPICGTILAVGFYFGLELHAIRSLMQNAWTVHDQDRWTDQSKILNPSFQFPDAYQILRRRKSADGN